MRILTAILLIVLSVSSAVSQTPVKKLQPSPDAAAAEKISRARRSKAIAMVEKTAGEAAGWKDRTLAAGAFIDSARLLWKENPARAIVWLREAWQIASEIKENRTYGLSFLTGTARSRLRNGVLSVALDNDRKVFEIFIKQIPENETYFDRHDADLGSRTARSQHFLDLAFTRTASDPKLAFDLASRSLPYGLSFGLERVLTSLRKRNVELANRLFDMAMVRMRDPVAEPKEAMVLSSYMFRPGYLDVVDQGGRNGIDLSRADLPSAAVAENARARALLRVFHLRFFAALTPYTPSESNRLAENAFRLGEQLLPAYKKHLPELVQPVSTFLGFMHERIYPNAPPWTGEQKVLSKQAEEQRYNEMIDRRLRDADQKPLQSFRDQGYIYVSIVMIRQADLPRAIKIAEKIDDKELRSNTISFLHYRAALDQIKLGNTQEAENLLPLIREPIRRLAARVYIARSLSQSLEKESSSEGRDRIDQRLRVLIGIIRNEIQMEAPSGDLVRLMFGVATVISKYDAHQAMFVFRQALEMLDKMPDYDLKANSAPEFRFVAPGISTMAFNRPFDGFGFKNVIEPIVAGNFDPIALRIETLTSPEHRGVARLQVATFVLGKNKQTPGKRASGTTSLPKVRPVRLVGH